MSPDAAGRGAARVSPRVERRRAGGARRHELVFGGGLVLVLVAFFLGAWQRRWIADDGLIVLRTVRNLVAGNGPVFNAGERVESNTSTVWTYLVYGTHEVFGYRLELVALGLALGLSLLAVASAMLGARVMLQGTRRAPAGRSLVLLPFGVLVYIVVPPARDFATSGLETGLVIAWIGLLWWAVQCWARAPHRERRFGLPSPLTAATAFLAGLGPLVRPEMALVAVVVLALLACARQGWAHLAWLVAIAGVVPVGYQVWRMSYYALPYPVTAVAKDAGGAKWGKGTAYLWDLLGPYTLLLPLAVVAVAGAVVCWGLRAGRGGDAPDGSTGAGTGDAAARGATRPGPVARVRALRERVRSTPVVTAAFLGVAVLMLAYELRVGGDFMHGRVLLPTLFLFLLPVAVLPVPTGPAGDRATARARRVTVPLLAASWLLVAGWAVYVQLTQDPFRDEPEQISTSGIVDERQFYIQRTGHAHPLLADDYADFPRMRALVESVSRNRTGAVYIPVPGVQDRWDVLAYDHPRPGMQPYELPEDPYQTVVFLNLGMTSMNLPLDVKVYDTVGLSAPLAAHTRRMEDGRIGHDKFLPYDWVLAETGVIEEPTNYPRWIDVNWVEQAEVALQCPATRVVLDSYRAPLTRELRLQNLMNAFSYAEYRIDRIPAYEVQRCGLPMPEKVEKHPGTK